MNTAGGLEPPPETAAGHTGGARGLPVAVVSCAFLVFAGTLFYGFVWDDIPLIVNRAHLFSREGLWRLLSTDFFAFTPQRSQYFRPLVTLSFYSDYTIWGLKPFGFHLTNVLAHAAAALGVYWLAKRLAGAAPALAAGILFALHPVHAESAAFVSGRTDLLATCFLLGALLAYANWRDRGGYLLAAVSLATYALALSSKETAVVLPLLLALYEWTVRPGGDEAFPVKAMLRRSLPYLVVFGIYFLARTAALGRIVDESFIPWADVTTRGVTCVKLLALYGWLVLIPFPQNLYYEVPKEALPPGPLWWLALAWLSLLIALSVFAAKRHRTAGFAVLWCWITLLPAVAANLLPLRKALMADRFLYTPSVGICLLGGLGIARLLAGVEWGWRLPLPGWRAVLVASGLVAMAGATLARNEDWRDDLRLSTRMVETSPGARTPRYNLGINHLRRGDWTMARFHLEKAAAMGPEHAGMLSALALSEAMLGELDKALLRALRARELDPRSLTVLNILGEIRRLRREPALAAPLLEESLRLNPAQLEVNLNLAAVLAELDRTDEAQAALERGRRLNAVAGLENPNIDRIEAVIATRRDPARARALWQRYADGLRAIAARNPRQQADLAYAERQLAGLAERDRK